MVSVEKIDLRVYILILEILKNTNGFGFECNLEI